MKHENIQENKRLFLDPTVVETRRNTLTDVNVIVKNVEICGITNQGK